ncbi:hypothetical protein [Rhizobium setariae]|uniref:hypothetical protein n=1 Tax=Rhizobium setariae TaxID=2801340 RepID=UPI001FEFB920|nr:hypothetical protein [Rhizobium setariae]
MKTVARTCSAALALAMLPAVAMASSEEEWKKMAADVEKQCTQAASDTFKKPQVAVDPTGSENYGLAIVYGRSKEAKAPAAIICVYDKKTMKVELGSELSKDLVRIRKPKVDGDQDASKKDAGNQDKSGGEDDAE